MFNNIKIQLLSALILLNTLNSLPCMATTALPANEATVVTNVWENNGEEFSSILVNDKVVYTVKTNSNPEAQDKVEVICV